MLNVDVQNYHGLTGLLSTIYPGSAWIILPRFCWQIREGMSPEFACRENIFRKNTENNGISFLQLNYKSCRSMGAGKYSSPFLSSALDGVELSGLVPADVSPGKQSPVPIVQEALVHVHFDIY
jgi:hypothetical protein